MKMVKSLLLGSAAGLVAVAGAQAADLPVKAKAVEYVKVCSLYGAGFYYIPGTDTCIKIGGYVRYEGYHNGPTGNYLGVGTTNAAAGYTRHTNTWTQQARFRQTMDVRSQTEYGTLRAYAAYGINFLNTNAETVAAPSAVTGNISFGLERAFIQFAGFTIGRSDTFFAFYNGAAYGFVPTTFGSSSGPAGLNVAAYTWQFGNGVSATVSLEDAAQHNKAVADLSTAATSLFGAAAFGAAGNDYGGQRIPDIVANIRVDQAWGSAQIMGALHEVRGRYFTGPAPAGVTLCGAVNANSTACGNPGDEWGWAVGAGITLKMPWDPKDTFSVEAGYTEGALSYISSIGAVTMHKSGGLAFGPMTDAVYANPGVGGQSGQLELTESWGIVGAFEHYWTPTFRQAIVAGYQEVKYSNNAKAMIAAAGCAGIGGGFTAGTWSNCNPDWSFWRVATRVLWNPVANLDVGVEVAYSQIDTAFAGTVFSPGTNAATGLSGGTYAITEQDVWTATFRIQRNFWP